MDDGRIEVERGVRLSDSRFWDWQAEIFARRGPDVWAHTVPFYPTSNPFVADRYARLIHGYLTDLARQGHSGEQVPIIELGAGSGQFGYYCVTRLAEIFEAAPTTLQPLYVMTDIVEANVEFWEQHPGFSRHLGSGLLDMAYFDVDRPAPLRLRANRGILDAAAPSDGIVCIANYVFDSTRMDAFQAKGGRVDELRLTTTAPEGHADMGEPVDLRRLGFSFSPARAPARGSYPVPLWNEIVRSYADDPALDGAFTFPVAMLSALEFLRRLGGGRLMLITSDEGYQDASEIAGRKPPPMTPTGDFIFTLMNFDAIRRFAERSGGAAFHGAMDLDSLRTGTYLIGGEQAAFPQTAAAAMLSQDFGPGDYFNLYARLRDSGELDLATILSNLRLSCWDPHLLSVLAARLRPLIEKANPRQRAALRAGLVLAEALVYRRPGMKDYHFDIGLLRQALQDDEDALRNFELSLASAGETPEKHHHMGLSRERLGDHLGAIAHFERATTLIAENRNAKEQA